MNTISKDGSSTVFSSLESLRILAAIAVVLAHSNQFHIPLLQPFIGGTIFLGSLGVDIFFIISGFVMGIAAKKSDQGVRSAANFFISRLFRLFPLYALVSLAAVVYLLVKGRPVDPLHVAESLLFLPTEGQVQVNDPIINAGWTLRFEMYFYILVTLGIAANRRLLVPTIGIFGAVAAWLWNGFYFGAPIVIEFIAGYALWFHKEAIIDKVRLMLGFKPFFLGMILSILLLMLSATGNDFGERNHGMYSEVPRLWIVYSEVELCRLVAWGLPAFLLVYFCIGLEKDMKWRIAPLGKYTYGVYLLQFFALLVAGRINKLAWVPDVAAFGIGMFLLAIGSVLSFHLIESPAMKLKRHFPVRLPGGTRSA